MFTNSWSETKKFSPAGNRTPVSRVTGGDTYHYTTEDWTLIGNVLKTNQHGFIKLPKEDAHNTLFLVW